MVYKYGIKHACYFFEYEQATPTKLKRIRYYNAGDSKTVCKINFLNTHEHFVLTPNYSNSSLVSAKEEVYIGDRYIEDKRLYIYKTDAQH